LILLLSDSEALEGESNERRKRHQVTGNSGMNAEHASLVLITSQGGLLARGSVMCPCMVGPLYVSLCN
jgi:hypothetical protein